VPRPPILHGMVACVQASSVMPYAFGILETRRIPLLQSTATVRDGGRLRLHDRRPHLVCFEGSISESAEDSAGSFFGGV
jgi:hypothetical protein